MVESIGRIDPRLIAQILGPGEETIASPVKQSPVSGELKSLRTFDDVLQKATQSLEDVSRVENDTNLLIQQYTEGRAELSDVMIATAKMNLSVQLAVAVVTSAVNTFKEMTQMQI
ncbi:MAG: flagellar hook-basal body complex protein FliE [Candidatus Margulisiibacteriota bacterium]